MVGFARPGSAAFALRCFRLAALLLAFSSAACTRDPQIDPGSLEPDNHAIPRVVVISIDGLRGDAIAAANAPTLLRLIREGSSSMTAQTVMPSLTLPAHTSMLTGVIPLRHGILWNDDLTTLPQLLEVPTIFDVIRDAGYTSAMFVGKSKLRTIVHTSAPTRVSIPPVDETWLADKVASQVLAYIAIAKPKPNMIFIHLPDVDLTGHDAGWMSPAYLATVRHTDSTDAQLWQGLKLAFGTDLTLIITADHGGLDHAHYDGSLSTTTIPWIAWGRGVQPHLLSGDVHVVDTAPTVLWLLGLVPPAGWDGVAVMSAFQLPVR